MEDVGAIETLKKELKDVNVKLDIISKQKMTPDRAYEKTNLQYEKDQIEHEIYRSDVETGKVKPKKVATKNKKSDIAKMVKSIKGMIRI